MTSVPGTTLQRWRHREHRENWPGHCKLDEPAGVRVLESIILNGILIAVVAHALTGASLVWDKVLLQRKGTQNLLAYVFWLGAISVFGLLLIPFGFRMPPFKLAGIAFSAGLLDLVASYFYYAALKAGEASDELTAMGGFTPVATVLLSVPLLKSPLGGHVLGFALMTAGGFVMFFAEKRPIRAMLPNLLIASSCFGLANVLQKIAFDGTGFVSGYVFFTIGTTVGSLALLIPSSWRKQVLEKSEDAPPRSKFWYMVNRFMAGVGSFLVVFAISRTRPALVEAISGVRYMIVFFGAWLITKIRPEWFTEDFSRWSLIAKAAATALILAGLVIVGMGGGSVANGPA